MINGKPERLVWIDLEMTGLDVRRDSIIEIAMVITDTDLNELDVFHPVAIHQDDEVLDSMDDWNTRQHGQSGLTSRVRESHHDHESAEREALGFLEPRVQAGSSPMCGNSICQDRRFLAREMPVLEKFFHYRNLDVSSLKILAALWAPDVLAGFSKSSEHLALADIRDSIAELRHYRQTFLSSARGS